MTSVWLPTTRVARPCTSRTAIPRASIQRYEPSRCWIRCSCSKCWLAPERWASSRLRERGAVVRVDAAEPLAAGVAELGLAVAEHLLPARGEVQAVLANVPVPQAVVGALQRERVALLGLGQPRERVLVRDRVAERALERGQVGDALGDAGLGGRDVGVAVGRVVEQQHGGVRRVKEDLLRELQPAGVGVDQEGVMRVLVEGGVGGLLARDPVDRVAGTLDRLQRLLHGQVALLVALDDEHGDLIRQLAHSASGGSAAESSQ